MRRNRSLAAGASLLSLTVAAGLLAGSGITGAAADTVSTATGSAYGAKLEGPTGFDAQPTAESQFPGNEGPKEDTFLEVPADPLATSFTGHVEADSAAESTIDALLQATMDDEASGLPDKWNARGYAIGEDLEAVTDQVKADVIESESVSACSGGETVFATAARVLNLSLGGNAIPIINPSPNQELIDAGGIRIVFWETNWDPATFGTTDGTDVVFANGLHVTAPLSVDLIVSHSEATSACAAQEPLAECEDGKDNDRDGKVDFPADPGCKNPKDDDERDPAECEDGKDNDGDGKIDFPDDPGCTSPKDDDERDEAAPPAQPIPAQPDFTG